VKRNWLLYLVIFSLALNFGTIGTLLYLHYQGPPPAGKGELPPLPVRELWSALNLEPGQRQALRNLFPEHRRRVVEMRTALDQRRAELLDLMQQEAPAWEALRAKVQEISNLQGQLEEEMVRFLLETKRHLKPEQRQAFLTLMQTRLERGGPPGRPWGRGRGFGKGPGPGMDRGPGSFPPGPPPPPPPGPSE
jgi:Spy/CpxP family protein refolding chaperone